MTGPGDRNRHGRRPSGGTPGSGGGGTPRRGSGSGSGSAGRPRRTGRDGTTGGGTRGPGGAAGGSGAKASGAKASGAKASGAKSSGARGQGAKGAAPGRGGGTPPRRGGGGRTGPPRRPQRRTLRRGDPGRRLSFTLMCLAFVMSLFAGRLVQIQGFDAEIYAKEAAEKRMQTTTIPATRGEITDASGTPMAMSVETRTVFVDPALITAAQRGEVIARLSETLGVPAAEVAEKVDAKPSRYQVVKRGVPPGTARQLMAYELVGVNTELGYKRVYPGGALASNLIGFAGRDGKGLEGLEYAKNSVLAGRPGEQRVEYSRRGQQIPMSAAKRREPVPGRDVRLTLNRDIQWKAQEALNRQVSKSRAKSGSIVVMDPRTGRIVAMADAPTYDPNHPEESTAEQRRNGAVTRSFEPGSTNKVITTAGALEANVVEPDSVFTVPYSLRRYGSLFHDSHGHPTRKMTVSGILATSSNTGTMQIAEKLGKQGLSASLHRFGFGQKPGTGLPGETAGLLKDPGDWWGTQLYTISFGQGVSVNALQMASVYATIANKGVRVRPSIIAGTADDEGHFTPAPAPKKTKVVSPRTAQQVSKMLEGVTSMEGTAPKAQIDGYRVAGKTGTAERINPECGCYRGGGYTASFVGYAPADDPELVVLVAVHDPKRGSYYGGDVAAPVFSDVMSFALKTLKVPPTGKKSPKIKIYP